MAEDECEKVGRKMDSWVGQLGKPLAVLVCIGGHGGNSHYRTLELVLVALVEKNTVMKLLMV